MPVLTGYSNRPNWVLRHQQHLLRSHPYAYAVYDILCSHRLNGSNETVQIKVSTVADHLGISDRTVLRALKVMEEELGFLTKVRTRGANYYIIHDEPPVGVLMDLGADPEEQPKPKPKRERVWGGTDMVDAAAPKTKKKREDGPYALASYFQEEVILKRKMQRPMWHFKRGALMTQFKALMEKEAVTPDHLRRMIRRYATWLDENPLPEERQAWRMFMYRWDYLYKETAAKDASEVDYKTETKLDPRFGQLGAHRDHG